MLEPRLSRRANVRVLQPLEVLEVVLIYLLPLLHALHFKVPLLQEHFLVVVQIMVDDELRAGRLHEQLVFLFILDLSVLLLIILVS